jgi:predicted DNA binding CopG/RHH family protein
LKVPVQLLEAFRFKANYQGVPYQTVIKRLMKAWLAAPGEGPPA